MVEVHKPQAVRTVGLAFGHTPRQPLHTADMMMYDLIRYVCHIYIRILSLFLSTVRLYN